MTRTNCSVFFSSRLKDHITVEKTGKGTFAKMLTFGSPNEAKLNRKLTHSVLSIRLELYTYHTSPLITEPKYLNLSLMYIIQQALKKADG